VNKFYLIFGNFYVIFLTKMTTKNLKTGCQRNRTGFWF